MSVHLRILHLHVMSLHTFSFESLRILSLSLTEPRGLCNLSSQPGILPGFTAMRVRSPNRWTARQFPRTLCIDCFKWLLSSLTDAPITGL